MKYARDFVTLILKGVLYFTALITVGLSIYLVSYACHREDVINHEYDPEYVKAFIYYDGNEKSGNYDIKMIKLSDALSYDGKWLVCDNRDGTKSYYYNCRIVIRRVNK